MKQLTPEEISSLQIFYTYITTERPYEDMERSSYVNLHKTFNSLPITVFSKRNLRSLFHFRYDAGAVISSSSGVVSCTTKEGLKHIVSEWCCGENSKVFETSVPSKVVCVRKLLRLYSKRLVPVSEKMLGRANKEKEYIILLDDFSTTRVTELRKR